MKQASRTPASAITDRLAADVEERPDGRAEPGGPGEVEVGQPYLALLVSRVDNFPESLPLLQISKPMQIVYLIQ